MAWKDVGLGWVFGAKDKGAQKQVDGLAGGMERLDDGVKAVNTSARMNKLSAFIASVSLAKLGSIADKLDDLGGSAGSANMTTGLEATMVGFDKVSSVAGVSMGLTGDVLKKFKKDSHSMAYSLNTDIGTVTKAFQAVHASRLNIKDLGLTMQDLVKIQEVTGVDAEKLVDVYKSLQSSYGLTSKQSKGLVDQIVAQGQAMGFGVEMFQQVPDILGKMDEAFAATLKEEGPDAVYKTMKSISMLGSVAQKTMGGTIPDNTAMAMNVFQKLTGAENQFRQMASGLAKDVPDFYQQMSLAGVDVDSMFKLMKQDPLEFAASMRKMIQVVRKTGDVGALDRLKNTVRDLGPQFTFLVEQTGSVGAEIDNMLASSKSPVRNSENALRDLARTSYKTGLTLDDQLGRIQDVFKTRLNKVAGDLRWKFLARQRKTFKGLGDVIEKVGKEKGPIGDLVRRFSLLKQVGIGALFPLNKAGQAIGGIADMALAAAGDMAPYVTALGSMGLKFGDVKKAIGKIGKPFGIFKKMLGGLPGPIKTVLKMVGPLGLIAGLVGVFGKDLEGLFSKLATDIPRFLLKYIFKIPAKDLKKMKTPKALWVALGGKIWSTLKSSAVWVYDKMTTGIGLFGDLLKKAGDWLQKQDWKKIFGNAFTWIGNAFLNIGDFIIDAFEGLWSWIWGDDSKKEAQKQTDNMKEGFGDKLGKGVESAIDGIGDVATAAVKQLFGKIFNFWGDESKTFGEKLSKTAKVMMVGLAGGMMFSPRLRSRVFGSLKNVLNRHKKMMASQTTATCGESQAAAACMGAGMAGLGAAGAAGGGTAASYLIGPRTGRETLSFAKESAEVRAAMGVGGGMGGLIPTEKQMGGGMFKNNIISRGFRRMGVAAKGFAKSMVPGLKAMGGMVASYGGILALSGAFDPMLEKIGMTKNVAKATTNILGGAGLGFSVGGPIGAGIGAVAGLVYSLATGLTKTKWSAENVDKTINEMAGSAVKNLGVAIPWAERLKDNMDLQEVLKLNEAMGNWGEKANTERVARMIQSAKDSAEATANTYLSIADSYKWSSDQINKAAVDTSEQVSRMMKNLFGFRIEADKVRESFAGAVGLGFEVKAQKMAKVYKEAEQKMGLMRTATTKGMRQQAFAQFKIMGQQSAELHSYLNRLEGGTLEEQAQWKKLQPTIGVMLKQMDMRYASSRILMEKWGFVGKATTDDFIGHSWGIDMARGFEMIADKAQLTEKAFTGVMQEGSKPALKKTAREMVNTVLVRSDVQPAIGQPTFADVNVPGGGNDGTMALIAALVTGFGEVVNELQFLGKVAGKSVNVRINGTGGATESGSVMGAYG